MITCEEATRLMSESLDRKLPVGKRIGLRMHLLMCRLCPRFWRQLFLLKNASDVYKKEMEEDTSISLSAETREKIKNLFATDSEKKDSIPK
jgi:hypothetical protein